MIKVKLAAARQWQEIEYRRGMRVKDIIEMLRYHPASIALISLNGSPTDENAELRDGDELILVPTVGGGSCLTSFFCLYQLEGSAPPKLIVVSVSMMGVRKAPSPQIRFPLDFPSPTHIRVPYQNGSGPGGFRLGSGRIGLKRWLTQKRGINKLKY